MHIIMVERAELRHSRSCGDLGERADTTPRTPFDGHHFRRARGADDMNWTGSMNWASAAQMRVREATDLAAVLAMAYEVFDGMLTEIRQHEGRDESMFAAFVMAAASAADGRDEVAAAPSLPPAGNQALAAAELAGSAVDIARALADLSEVLARRLTEAARSAPEPDDQAACARAAWHAGNIHALLHGSGP
jgi:hypothetical protein